MLGLGFLGVFFLCFGIGAILGLTYATIRYGIPVIIMFFVELAKSFKYCVDELKKSGAEGRQEGEAWLAKKGLK
ncbi:MAG: hypothetical protein QHH10_12100 [Peptococcaceae bacterium]|nr:hypothetical protein [Peptococcaceae bacterium]MDH7526046.1 hypothetical protein [Peptococcaceae bacterium]